MYVPAGQTPGIRLDVYLTRQIRNATRNKVQKGIKQGLVRVNGRTVQRPSYEVQPGDVIVCTLYKAPPVEARPEPIPLDIYYEDEHLIVVNKPAGMVVHPAYGHREGTLVNALLHHVGVRAPLRLEEEAMGEEMGLSLGQAVPRYEGDPTIRPGIVHRLDKDTSGLMVVAKDDATHAHLARQFMERTIERMYEAFVWGVPEPPEGRIEGAIGRDPRDRKRMAVVPAERGKYAVTHYRVLEALPYVSRVAFKLETGRTHQIRVHARHIGHPLLGDPTYGGQQIGAGPGTRKRKAFFKRLFERMPRQALHARTLGFEHPHSGEFLRFEAELPEDMQDVWHELKRIEG